MWLSVLHVRFIMDQKITRTGSDYRLEETIPIILSSSWLSEPLSNINFLIFFFFASKSSNCPENGQVFSWGYGVLGLGPKVEHSRNPRLIPPPLFGANELNPDSVPVRLEAGMANFAAVTNRGHLYTWGRNNNGSLGLGHTKSQMFPLMVRTHAKYLLLNVFGL